MNRKESIAIICTAYLRHSTAHASGIVAFAFVAVSSEVQQSIGVAASLSTMPHDAIITQLDGITSVKITKWEISQPFVQPVCYILQHTLQ